MSSTGWTVTRSVRLLPCGYPARTLNRPRELVARREHPRSEALLGGESADRSRKELPASRPLSGGRIRPLPLLQPEKTLSDSHLQSREEETSALEGPRCR